MFVRLGGNSVGHFLLFLAILLAPAARAEDIYKWTDEQGRVHYSNRGGEAPQVEPLEGSGSEEGWESALERKQGTDEFYAAADSAINSLQARLIRRKRDRGHAQEALEATQAEILRAQTFNPNAVPELRAHEVTQLADVRKIDAEIAVIEARIARVRALKAFGKSQSEKPAPAPFGQ